MRYIHPVTDTLKAMLSCGWSVDSDENRYRDASGDTKHLRRPTITKFALKEVSCYNTCL
ncbi:unnamed protein product [Trichobilharzia regenti]|nr:unnamed protein product [Trichobilharzia regenti]